MSEKEIPAIKEKKEKVAAKKKVAEKPEKKAVKVDLKESEINPVGDVKPAARRRKSSEETAIAKPVKSATTAEAVTDSETVSILPVKPRVRKAAGMEKAVTSLDSNPAAKKSIVKAVQSERANVEISAEVEAKAETPEISADPEVKAAPQEILPDVETEKSESALEERSPIFKELAAPKLPALQPENRARLQMQSPTRIYFYWSLKSNPFETLGRIFGGRSGKYTLVVKLQNRTNETERVVPIDSFGSWWFDVEPDSRYRAEVGFFSADKPFIRLMSSNEIETPRTNPSPFFDWSPQFAVTSQEFAEVLDVSGYPQDAFEVALAGDNIESADRTTFDVFTQLMGENVFDKKASELRLVLFALASGLSLYDLRDQISADLFAVLEKFLKEKAASFTPENVISALNESFGFDFSETDESETEISYSVVGASRINLQKFPRNFRKNFSPGGSSTVAGSSK